MVTSEHLLPSILPLLKPTHKVNLLRAYFAVCLGYSVSRPRPPIDIEGFFTHTSIDPKTLTGTSPAHPTDPWRTIFSHIASQNNKHQIKAERALARGAALYGSRLEGWIKEREPKGAEWIDGTLFLRTGGLLIDTKSWTRRPSRTRATRVRIGTWCVIQYGYCSSIPLTL
jgi:hypothetical protein